MDANIISYNPGPYSFDNSIVDIVKKANSDAEMSLHIDVIMRYSADDPTFGMQFDITCEIGERRLLKFGFVIGMASKEMEEYLKSGNDFSKERTELIPICSKAWDFASGILAAQSYESIREVLSQGLILPQVSPSAIAQDIILDKR